MKPPCFFVCVVFYGLICGCNSSASKSEKNQPKNGTTKSIDVSNNPAKIDTTKSIKILGLWATPTQLINYDTMRVTGDTLHLVTCNEYVYSPFGIIKNKAGFKSSLLKSFDIKNKVERMNNGLFEFNRLTFKESKIIFWFDTDPESSKHSSILKGEIYNNDIVFSNGLRTGISTNSFYKIFFTYFPEQLKSKFNVVVLDPCIDGVNHIYSFKNGELNSVKFISDSYWKVDY